MRKLKIYQSFILVIFIGIIALFIVSFRGISEIKFVKGQEAIIYHDKLIPIKDISSVKSEYLLLRLNYTKVMDSGYTVELDKLVKDSISRLNTNLSSYSKANMEEADEIKQLADLKGLINNYEVAITKLVSESNTTNKYAVAERDSARVIGENLLIKCDDILKSDLASASDMDTQIDSIVTKDIVNFIIISIISALVLIAIFVLTLRRLKYELKEIKRYCEVIDGGDLTGKFKEKMISSENELGGIAKMINSMNESFRAIIQKISEESSNIKDFTEKTKK
ncbi:MAG TPA: MCP four helix bundle domain-containing protein [Clostridium sp.]|uniref:MCP four helix bundle domain-containing protein n=1 Tax=Clostridium sp. TaxID=1506 RepID=UPI002F9408B4